ncbi:hypothetical protein FE391_19645 [Nonomuraea sp. KC401]|uniref:hypothetical protein n=1 Tax=unclassified Nonomuraea TaxID=2593643 RepID=UPI0010FF047E|nr:MULTISPECIES: hypothetical protein [unclassified Nonomuraea]NBE95811.1 hypothetical protein [Nonomuraea sp. K271]TLF71301.1 hypothetical protein FE391_19645 [Nonomuraea sp. KC401]
MPTLEEEIRQLMADETGRLQAAPDLAERVMRFSHGKRKRVRAAALAASVAVIAAAPIGYVTVGSVATTGPEPAISAVPEPTTSATPEPPAIDDTPPVPSPTPDLGDLGDGKEFGHVKVGYLPEGLRWSNRSLDFGDRYTTSYNLDGDKNGSYCVQIYMHEDAAVQEIEDRIQAHRDEGDGEEITVGDRTGYLVIQNVGEDGMKGTPTLFLRMGDRQRAEIMFSPVYVKEFSGAEAVGAELKRIAEGLTSTL